MFYLGLGTIAVPSCGQLGKLNISSLTNTNIDLFRKEVDEKEELLPENDAVAIHQ
jgi:hypothetical protein